MYMYVVHSRPPSVRVDRGYSILVVCLAEASATMTVKTDATDVMTDVVQTSYKKGATGHQS